MLRKMTKLVCATAVALAIGAHAAAQPLTVFYGAGTASAINANQFAGSGQLQIGPTLVNENSLTTLLSLGAGPAGSLVGTSTHTLDCGSMGSITTLDDLRLDPINAAGLFRLTIQARIVSGTGSFSGVNGRLHFTGTANMATGEVRWMVYGYYR